MYLIQCLLRSCWKSLEKNEASIDLIHPLYSRRELLISAYVPNANDQAKETPFSVLNLNLKGNGRAGIRDKTVALPGGTGIQVSYSVQLRREL